MGNTRIKQFLASSDTLYLDSLSLVPDSFKLKTASGVELDTSYYKVNDAEGIVVLNRKKMQAENISLDSLSTSYKTFPYLFSSETELNFLNQYY